MDSRQPQESDPFRYRARVQAVAVIDILLGVIPFIKLGFSFNDQSLADIQDREYLVLVWMTILVVYVLQLIMAIWLLAATRECNEDYAVGNCQVWLQTGLFLLCFYVLELVFDIVSMLQTPAQTHMKQAILQLSGDGTKIVYRITSLLVVNNFVTDLNRPTLFAPDYYTRAVRVAEQETRSQGNYLVPRNQLELVNMYPPVPVRSYYPQPKMNGNYDNNVDDFYGYLHPQRNNNNYYNNQYNNHSYQEVNYYNNRHTSDRDRYQYYNNSYQHYNYGSRTTNPALCNYYGSFSSPTQ